MGCQQGLGAEVHIVWQDTCEVHNGLHSDPVVVSAISPLSISHSYWKFVRYRI